MSALDLTEAVEAAERAFESPDYLGCSCCASDYGLDTSQGHTRERAIARQAVDAAAPIIAAQVRAQNIETLNNERDEITGSRGPQDESIASESSFLSGLDHAIEVIKDGAR